MFERNSNHDLERETCERGLAACSKSFLWLKIAVLLTLITSLLPILGCLSSVISGFIAGEAIYQIAIFHWNWKGPIAVLFTIFIGTLFPAIPIIAIWLGLIEGL